jgi:uncharacterized protein (DUF58 family)
LNGKNISSPEARKPNKAIPALALNERADAASHTLPPLLVEAERIAATVMQGIHGRKRAGPGESFWQYRAYGFGDSTSRIDWRKSARSSHVFIRENEWEAANTLWLWASPSKSMDFKSHLSKTTKRDRAYLMTLALASLALRAQERVGLIGSPQKVSHARGALVPMATWLLRSDGASLPQSQHLQKFSSVVLLGDFLEKPEDIAATVRNLAAHGVSGHIVQIIDPAEETLPYDGRVEFRDMDGPLKYLAGKTETLRDAYIEKFASQREAVRRIAHGVSWSFTLHHTDQSPAKLLMMLHGLVGGAKSRAFDLGGFA